ncbi:MAG: Gfo/Idh/MocA family oxidoreductase [Candidatus Coatesbacteria bacterium]
MKTLRVGIIGTGGIAQTHLQGYKESEGVEVVAACDVREEAARSTAQKWNIPNVYTDYRKMFKEQKLDLVSVATPNAFHMAPTVAALQAGCHVLCEKPIAMNAREGAIMCAAAKKARRMLDIGLNCRFIPGNQALKKFVVAGELGKIYYVRVQALRRRGIPGWGAFTRKDMSGGGPLIDIGVHQLDLALWLMGHPEPVSVTGNAYCVFGKRKNIFAPWGAWDPKTYTVEDMAAGMVRFRNGATLTLEASWAAHIEHDVWNVSLMGTDGGASTSPLRMFKEEQKTLLDVSPAQVPNLESHTAEVQALVHAIRTGGKAPVPGEQALMVTRILDGIYQSAKTGREVRL